MTPEERSVVLSSWNGVAVFASLLSLDAGFIKAAIVALFVGISCHLQFGGRWLLRAGFALAILAIAVALGFPPPAQWPALAKSTSNALRSMYAASVPQSTPGDQH